MAATRQLKDFKVRNTEGNLITVQRRCFGDGKAAQAQLEKMIYDEKTKKFRSPTKAEQTKKVERGDHVVEDLTMP